MNITFSEPELDLIQRIAEWRTSNAARIGAGGEHFLPAIKRERIGVQAEAAFAKATGWPWHSMLRPKSFGQTVREKNRIKADVGDWEVRGTDAANGSLLLQKDDPELLPDGSFRPYVLVIAVDATARLVGFEWAIRAKSPRFWADWMKRPCFRVPQQQLSRQFDTRKWQLVKDLSQKYQLQEQS